MGSKTSKIYPTWEGYVSDDGRLFIKDQKGFDSYLIPYMKKKVYVVVKDHSKDRSRKEEKYYHGVVVRMVAEEMGISYSHAHEFLKEMFLTIEDKVTVKGREIRFKRTLSTTELTDEAYRKYWKKCVEWASLPTEEYGLGPESGLGLYIPLPNEVDYEDSIHV